MSSNVLGLVSHLTNTVKPLPNIPLQRDQGQPSQHLCSGPVQRSSRTGYLDEVISHLNCLVDSTENLASDNNRVRESHCNNSQNAKPKSLKAEGWDLAPPTPLKIPGKTKGISKENLALPKSTELSLEAKRNRIHSAETTEAFTSSKSGDDVPSALPANGARNDDGFMLREPHLKTRSRRAVKNAQAKSLPMRRKFFGLFPGKISVENGMPLTKHIHSEESLDNDAVTQSWFSKLFGVKPESCAFYFDTLPAIALSTICSLLRALKEQNYRDINIFERSLASTLKIRIGKRNCKFPEFL